MKLRLAGIGLMTLGALVLFYLVAVVLVWRGLPTLICAAVTIAAGKYLYSQGGPSNGMLRDVLEGFKAIRNRFRNVKKEVQETLAKD